jgi:hypothetical protein
VDDYLPSNTHEVPRTPLVGPSKEGSRFAIREQQYAAIFVRLPRLFQSSTAVVVKYDSS